jgi:hypothetical protein
MLFQQRLSCVTYLTDLCTFLSEVFFGTVSDSVQNKMFQPLSDNVAQSPPSLMHDEEKFGKSIGISIAFSDTTLLCTAVKCTHMSCFRIYSPPQI